MESRRVSCKQKMNGRKSMRLEKSRKTNTEHSLKGPSRWAWGYMRGNEWRENERRIGSTGSKVQALEVFRGNENKWTIFDRCVGLSSPPEKGLILKLAPKPLLPKDKRQRARHVSLGELNKQRHKREWNDELQSSLRHGEREKTSKWTGFQVHWDPIWQSTSMWRCKQEANTRDQ